MWKICARNLEVLRAEYFLAKTKDLPIQRLGLVQSAASLM